MSMVVPASQFGNHGARSSQFVRMSIEANVDGRFGRFVKTITRPHTFPHHGWNESRDQKCPVATSTGCTNPGSQEVRDIGYANHVWYVSRVSSEVRPPARPMDELEDNGGEWQPTVGGSPLKIGPGRRIL